MNLIKFYFHHILQILLHYFQLDNDKILLIRYFILLKMVPLKKLIFKYKKFSTNLVVNKVH